MNSVPDAGEGPELHEHHSDNRGKNYDPTLEKTASAKAGGLTTEIALKENRKVIVYYPQDLTEEEAVKVGKVLGAITG